MKKIFALILCIATVCLSACAFAETAIYWSGRSTSGFPSWSTPDTSTGLNGILSGARVQILLQIAVQLCVP